VEGFTLNPGESATDPYSINVINGMTYNGELLIVATFNGIEIGRYSIYIKINP
jgi:hypothetical protein